MTLAGLSLRTVAEYEAASVYEIALRAAVDAVPSWLYDASEVGTVIDDLNRARSDYERAHPDEPVRRSGKPVICPFCEGAINSIAHRSHLANL